jgi:hypothetical protein
MIAAFVSNPKMKATGEMPRTAARVSYLEAANWSVGATVCARDANLLKTMCRRR